jgi:hypothetical protein
VPADLSDCVRGADGNAASIIAASTGWTGWRRQVSTSAIAMSCGRSSARLGRVAWT